MNVRISTKLTFSSMVFLFSMVTVNTFFAQGKVVSQTHPLNQSKSTHKTTETHSDETRVIGSWNIRVQVDELALNTVMRNQSLLILYSPQINRVIFMSSFHDPVSRQSIKEKLKTMKGKNLKTLNFKTGLIFSFIEGNKLHWFSTQGGHLIADLPDRLSEESIALLRSRVSSRLL